MNFTKNAVCQSVYELKTSDSDQNNGNMYVHSICFCFLLFFVNKFLNFSISCLFFLPLKGFFGTWPSCSETSKFLCHSPCQKLQGLSHKSTGQNKPPAKTPGHQFHTRPLPSEALAWPGQACPHQRSLPAAWYVSA